MINGSHNIRFFRAKQAGRGPPEQQKDDLWTTEIDDKPQLLITSNYNEQFLPKKQYNKTEIQCLFWAIVLIIYAGATDFVNGSFSLCSSIPRTFLSSQFCIRLSLSSKDLYNFLFNCPFFR